MQFSVTAVQLSILLILGSLIFTPQPSAAQQARGDAAIDMIQAFSQHHQDLPRERVFIQTDRDSYFWGDRIWFSAIVTGGTDNLFSGISRLLYVELYDDAGSRIDRTFVRLENGSGNGSLTFGESETRTGTFTLVAYTSWMLNFEAASLFTKPLQVVSPGMVLRQAAADPSDVRLHLAPEGGSLLSGVPAKVAVKSTLPDGRAVSVSAELRDDAGATLLTFETDAYGLAAFTFTPEAGRGYEAVILQNQNSAALPPVQENGARLSVSRDASGGQFVLGVQLKGEPQPESLTVFGHVRGRVFYLAEMELFDGRGMGWASADLFPPGIVEFVVLGTGGALLTKRPVLNLPEPQLQLSLSTPQTVFGTRQQVALRHELRDENGRRIEGLASLSVTVQPEDTTMAPPRSDIYSSLLTGYAFDFDEPSLRLAYFLEQGMAEHADLALLTAPEQSFAWEVLQNPEELAGIRLPENGFSVSGTIRTGFRGRPVSEANVVFAMGPNDDDLFVIDTSEDGYFLMNDIDITGSAQVSIRATDRRGRRNVRIGLDEQFDFLPELSVRAPQLFDEVAGDAAEDEALAARIVQARQNEEQHIMAAMQIELEEITVTGEREDFAETLSRMATGDVGGTVLRVSDLPELQSLTIYDLLMRLPGVQVSGTSVRVRTGAIQDTPPVILLDGAAIEEELLGTISASDVDNLSVLRRPEQLARFGAQGANGVISIRTIRGEGIPGRNLPVVSAFLKGFDEPPPFFSPRYGGILPQLTDERPDTRVTLHWQPNFVIQQQGRDILFWTGDVPGTYCATVQGLTPDGRPFGGELCFEVEG